MFIRTYLHDNTEPYPVTGTVFYAPHLTGDDDKEIDSLSWKGIVNVSTHVRTHVATLLFSGFCFYFELQRPMDD